MPDDKCTDFANSGFQKGDIVKIKAPKDTKILWGSAGMIATTGKSGKYVITEVSDNAITIEKKKGRIVCLYQMILKRTRDFVSRWLC